MKNTMLVLAPGVIVENLGSDSAVFVPGVAEVLTLSGDAATVIRRIRNGESVVGAQAVVSDLVARGVIQPAHGMSRRGVVRAGVIGAGAGIAALAMPSVAAASSTGDGGSSGGGVVATFVFVSKEVVSGTPDEFRVTVKAQDSDGNDLGPQITGFANVSGTPKYIMSDNSEVVLGVSPPDRFVNDGPVDTATFLPLFNGGGNTLTFTFAGNGITYSVPF